MQRHRASAFLLSLACIVAGGAESASARKPARAVQDPVAIARSYALSHLALFPRGTRLSDLSYDTTVQGDYWVVEVSPKGYLGGGVRLLVARRSGRVVEVTRTK